MNIAVVDLRHHADSFPCRLIQFCSQICFFHKFKNTVTAFHAQTAHFAAGIDFQFALCIFFNGTEGTECFQGIPIGDLFLMNFNIRHTVTPGSAKTFCLQGIGTIYPSIPPPCRPMFHGHRRVPAGRSVLPVWVIRSSRNAGDRGLPYHPA